MTINLKYWIKLCVCNRIHVALRNKMSRFNFSETIDISHFANLIFDKHLEILKLLFTIFYYLSNLKVLKYKFNN